MSVLKDFVEMYRKGGLEITSFGDLDGAATGQPLLRSVIQPTGNIMTWVGSETGSPEVWEKHYKKMIEHIRALQRLRLYLKNAANAGYILLLIPYISFNLANLRMLLNPVILANPGLLLKTDLVRVIISTAAYLTAAYLFKIVFSHAMRWYLRRQIKKYVSVLR